MTAYRKIFYVTRVGSKWSLIYKHRVIFDAEDINLVIRKARATAREYTPSELRIKSDATSSIKTELFMQDSESTRDT